MKILAFKPRTAVDYQARIGIVIVVYAGLYRGPIFQGAVGAAVLNNLVLPAVVQ